MEGIPYLTTIWSGLMKKNKVDFIKDAAGQEVYIGDLVIFTDSYTSNLVEGTVIKFTPKGVTMKYSDSHKDAINRRFAQVVKLPKTIRLERMIGL